MQNHLTPLMKQYFEIKKDFQDSLLLFQVGDFYELFFDDAIKASSCLTITLTKRGNINGDPIPLCGVPVHSIDHYLSKLIKGGFKVVICDQLEEAVPGKVVRRGVTNVLTPGTLTDSKLLNEKSASYLFSFFPNHNNWSLLFGEILSAQLFATLIPANAFKVLESELSRFFPDEILLPLNDQTKQLEKYFKQLGYFATVQTCDQSNNSFDDFAKWIQSQLDSETLKIIYENEVLKLSVYNFFLYLKKNQESTLNQFKKVNFYKPDDYLILDASTQKNLELIKNNQDNSTRNTLFELLDKANTAMGSRMIKKWILRPSIKKEVIIARQNAIECLMQNISTHDYLKKLIHEICDLERIVGRIALNKAQLNDYLTLSNALTNIPKIKLLLKNFNIKFFEKIESTLFEFYELSELLQKSLNSEISSTWIIKNGFDSKLDNLRELINNANKKIIDLEEKEQKLTGISSLKIRYNNISGYYIEVTKSNLHLIPEHYKRQQTLVGKERFVTAELQNLEIEIEKANNEIKFYEQQIFEEIKKEVQKNIVSLRKVANALSNLDAICSFAQIAFENGYVRPAFNDSQNIIIEDGKHPIVEKIINHNFIPNSTYLNEEEPLWIITGPNMGGKSTYLRQVALLCIMAQCGSYIPAKSASLPILDRIFTRIGAGDNLAEGKSTFLIEMEETAQICSNATEKSLVILDEVGRGTSTSDGLAIAQAVVEHIFSNIRAKCLFATHYHELTNLHNDNLKIAVYHMACTKTNDGILFLHKLIKGCANSSFGIEVAKLANLSPNIIKRAEEILLNLKYLNNASSETLNSNFYENKILELEMQITEQKKILSNFSNLNFDEISPKMAFDLLWQIKKLL